MTRKLVQFFTCFLVVAMVGCGGEEEAIPETEVPEEEVPEGEIPEEEEVTLNDFLGIWKVDSVGQISDDDLFQTRYLVIGSRWLGEIEIRGLFRTVHIATAAVSYPTLYAKQIKGAFTIQKQEFNFTSGVFSIEGKGQLRNDEIILELSINGSSETRSIKAKRFCPTPVCEKLISENYLGSFFVTGTRLKREYNTCDGCPVYTDTEAVALGQIGVVELFPFEVQVKTWNPFNIGLYATLSSFFRNDSLIIPPQYHPTQYQPKVERISYSGNIVVRDGRMIIKLLSQHGQTMVFDTLISCKDQSRFPCE